MSVKSKPAEIDGAAFCNLKEAATLTGLSASTILRLGRTDKSFPPRLEVTDRIHRYNRRELVDWIDARRDKKPLPAIRPRFMKKSRRSS